MKYLAAAMILMGAVLGVGSVHAQQAHEEWVVGRWEMTHDPEAREADTLEFTAEGDVYNIWSDGTRVPGIYVVTAEGVKTVFTRDGKDVIATFHSDAERSELRIVTSRSGAETIYEKVN